MYCMYVLYVYKCNINITKQEANYTRNKKSKHISIYLFIYFCLFVCLFYSWIGWFIH